MRSFGYAQDDNVGARHKKVDTLIKKVDALSKKSARDNKKSVRRTNVTVMTIERSDEESQSVTDLSQKKPLASPRRISKTFSLHSQLLAIVGCTALNQPLRHIT
jgi:hypothetical protein